MNLKEYWEDYASYWEAKVGDANQKEHDTADKTIADELAAHYVGKLKVQETDKFLDFGCGFCRIYPYYKKTTKCSAGYIGIDIAKAPLQRAMQEYPELTAYQLLETDGLYIPLEDGIIDRAICFGVFDACNQEVILRELLRVMKPGGKLLFTGKNAYYQKKDVAALTAEINARKKGHPNYFTSVPDMLKQLQNRSIQIEESYYFLKRGDFPNNQFYTEMPNEFYEWAFLVQKQEAYSDAAFTKFSDAFSDTYKEIYHGK